MNPSKLGGFWTKKDMTCYLFIERIYETGKKSGMASGTRYFIRNDGKEVTDKGKFVIDQQELKRDYVKGMKTNEDN